MSDENNQGTAAINGDAAPATQPSGDVQPSANQANTNPGEGGATTAPVTPAAPETPTAPATPDNVDTSADKEMNPPADTQQQSADPAPAPETPAAPTEPLPEFAQANPAREEVPEIIEASERVVYGGQHVSAVLRDGKELRTPDGMQITHYHCSMGDGTTQHVPVKLFV